jgi:cytochrome c-type biogenesis protein
MELIQDLMRDWYLTLSQFSAALRAPLSNVTSQTGLPFLGALLFGLVGSVAPCQLTTNLSAIAYVSRRVGEGRTLSEAIAYTLGKILVYLLVGGAVIFLGLQLQQAAIPVVVGTRKAVGPLMIIIGVGLLGLIRLRGSISRGFSSRLRSHLPQGGLSGAFSLGVVFSFTFCPTLFWLYFGLMIPLALASTGGWTFPALFALGTSLPLLAFSALLNSGTDLSNKWMERLKRSQRRIGQVSGAIFILAGINDTLTYWFI